MNPLKQSRVLSGSLLTFLVVAALASALAAGCAGVKPQSTTGNGGTGLSGIGGAAARRPSPVSNHWR